MTRCYYAHCIALYGTPQERRDLKTLEDLGFSVINPNSPDIEAQCREVREAFKNPVRHYVERRFLGMADAGQAVMELVFKPLLTPTNIDVIAFRALPDGRIPAGVMKELQWARTNGLPMIELPSNLLGREMTVAHTREYLAEVGER